MSRIQSVEATLPDFEVIQGAYAWCCATLAGQPIKTDDNKTVWQCKTLWPFEDEKNIRFSVGSLFASAPQTIVDSKAEKWARFQSLVKQWREERGARSSITETAMLPAYQK